MGLWYNTYIVHILLLTTADSEQPSTQPGELPRCKELNSSDIPNNVPEVRYDHFGSVNCLQLVYIYRAVYYRLSKNKCILIRELVSKKILNLLYKYQTRLSLSIILKLMVQ